MTPRAACGVTPQGASSAARQSRFRVDLDGSRLRRFR
jgi:hypothetical protein